MIYVELFFVLMKLLYIYDIINYMSKYTKNLYDEEIKNIGGRNLHLSVYGSFDTRDVTWSYYIISYIISGNLSTLTLDICKNYEGRSINSDTITCGIKVNDIEEGKKFISDFSMKWNSGSNNTTSEIRENKINEILK